MPWVILLVLAVLMYVFLSGDDVWTGFVYPNQEGLAERLVGEFSSLEDCRDAAWDTIEANGWHNADYDCGLNCRSEHGEAISICEETKE